MWAGVTRVRHTYYIYIYIYTCIDTCLEVASTACERAPFVCRTCVLSFLSTLFRDDLREVEGDGERGRAFLFRPLQGSYGIESEQFAGNKQRFAIKHAAVVGQAVCLLLGVDSSLRCLLSSVGSFPSK